MDKFLESILSKVLQIFYIILIAIIGYQIVKAIMGGTWATENIIIGALGIIMAGIFTIVGFLINQGKSIGILEERTKTMGNSLHSLGDDFKSHCTIKHK